MQMAYRDDVTALSARHEALADEVARKTRELEDSRAMLEQARARARLPVLDNIRIAAPCTVDWNAMTGDERVRQCGQCQNSVFNLSGMTRDAAEALMIERNGELCVRYFQRHDGTIMLADCTIGIGRDHRHRWIAAGAAALVAGGFGAAATLYQLRAPEMLKQDPPRVETPRPPPIMYRVSPPPTVHVPPLPVPTQPTPIGKKLQPIDGTWLTGVPAWSEPRRIAGDRPSHPPVAPRRPRTDR
jgi:hypothetical protein